MTWITHCGPDFRLEFTNFGAAFLYVAAMVYLCRTVLEMVFRDRPRQVLAMPSWAAACLFFHCSLPGTIYEKIALYLVPLILSFVFVWSYAIWFRSRRPSLSAHLRVLRRLFRIFVRAQLTPGALRADLHRVLNIGTTEGAARNSVSRHHLPSPAQDLLHKTPAQQT